MTRPLIHLVSVSGGADSLATWLVALNTQDPATVRAVTADTGHEHEETYGYLDYLESRVGPIERLRADFTAQLARKRGYIMEKWLEEGIAADVCERAAAILEPTGIPFLDLCLWKGRFPSRLAQFCTEFLKVQPIGAYVVELLDAGFDVWSWQGVRADESDTRRYLPSFEEVGGGLWINRPIIKWPKSACFEAADWCGIEHNPLYRQGMNRVGCMPCINCSKAELAEIARRFPWFIDRLEEWEALVGIASKRGAASFFSAPTGDNRGALRGDNIRSYVEWAKTTRGGRQYDLLKSGPAPACTSSYGLCE